MFEVDEHDFEKMEEEIMKERQKEKKRERRGRRGGAGAGGGAAGEEDMGCVGVSHIYSPNMQIVSHFVLVSVQDSC